MIKKIIFDFDDTITDNRLLDYMAFFIPCKLLKIKHPSKTKILKLRKKGKLSQDILPSNLDPLVLQNFLLLRKIFLNSSKCTRYLIPQKNLKLLLNNLREKKVECYICSSKNNKQIILDFLKQKKIDLFFKNVFVSSDLGFQIDNKIKKNRILIKKSLLHHILKKEINHNQILFVGNYDDFLSVKDTNLKFIFYQNDYLEKPSSKIESFVCNMIQLNSMFNHLYNTP